MSGATSVIQRSIFSACKSKMGTSEWAAIKIEEGDYPISSLRIPDHCKVLLFGREKTKLVHIGRRRQPLFVLGEKSVLKLQNLEIDYKGKESFMFQGRRRNPDNIIMENVKINRIRITPARMPARVPPAESVTPQQLLKFLKRYIESYRKECKNLTEEPPVGAGYPPMLVNKVYIDSKQIRAYLLKDGVVIADVVETEPSEEYELDRSMEIIPAKLKDMLADGTSVEVILAKRSLESFIRMVTLGVFKVEPAGQMCEYGRHSGLAKFTIRNEALKKERYVSYIAWYPYLDKAGWDPKNAWIYAFYDARYDIASAIATQEEVGHVYEVSGGGEIIATPTKLIWHEYDMKTKLGAKLVKFSKDIEEFERLLEESKSSEEKKFLDFLDEHPHLLDLYAVSIEPQPFLAIPETELSTIQGRGRLPDYIARYRDNTYRLIELERPSKPIFVGKDIRPSHELTQAINQVSVWSEIIRSFGNYLTQYPGIRNYRSLVVIGRENAQRFRSSEEFRSELNRINQQYHQISVITFDELVERARIAVAKIKAIQSSLG